VGKKSRRQEKLRGTVMKDGERKSCAKEGINCLRGHSISVMKGGKSSGSRKDAKVLERAWKEEIPKGTFVAPAYFGGGKKYRVRKTSQRP